MSDKQSLEEAVRSIRKRNRLVKKSLAGIDREFDVSAKPETKALTETETGFTSVIPKPMDELQPARRKLRLPKKKEPVAEEKPVEEVKPEEVKPEEVKPEEEKKKRTGVFREDGRLDIFEPRPSKYRIKKNVMKIEL
jgi:hypothetical protein